MTDRYPGYDVLAKRWTQSWNDATRETIDRRLSVSLVPRFFSADEWLTLKSVCDRIIPQPAARTPVPLAAYIDQKMADGLQDGYRYAELPPQDQAWRTGLKALDQAARHTIGLPFHKASGDEQDTLLRRMQNGDLSGDEWDGMPSRLFFEHRLLPDITHAYYAHPTAWNEIGFGGPASPRGYVRMGLNRRDAWEAVEAPIPRDGHVR